MEFCDYVSEFRMELNKDTFWILPYCRSISPWLWTKHSSMICHVHCLVVCFHGLVVCFLLPEVFTSGWHHSPTIFFFQAYDQRRYGLTCLATGKVCIDGKNWTNLLLSGVLNGIRCFGFRSKVSSFYHQFLFLEPWTIYFINYVWFSNCILADLLTFECTRFMQVSVIGY